MSTTTVPIAVNQLTSRMDSIYHNPGHLKPLIEELSACGLTLVRWAVREDRR
jgi:hypothetical protein